MNLTAFTDATMLPAGEAARIGRLLALEDADELDDVTLARHVAEGLPPSAVLALGELLGRPRVIGPIVPEPTLRRARRRRARLSREHSERLYEIGRVLDALVRVYRGDAERIEAFLLRPHPLLDGDTPLDMARSSSAGCSAVLNLIERAEAGTAI